MAVFDLFSGTGTIGQVLSSGCEEQVIGVEIVEEAVEAAKENAVRQRTFQLQIYCR